MSDETYRPLTIVHLIRWVLLPFSCLASWCLAIIIGIIILSIAESFCPDGQMVSGKCMAPWWEPVEACIFCFSTALSAFLVIVTAFYVAPTSRVTVSWLAFGIGGMTAIAFALGTSEWAMFASAVVTGFLTALVLARFFRTDQLVAQPNDRP